MPVFIPIELPKDNTIALKVTNLMSSPYHILHKSHDISTLIGILGSMNLVVGMRLHSLIFSVSCATPVIAISYDIKVDSFINDIDSNCCIPLQQLTADKLKSHIDAVADSGFARINEAARKLRQGEEINVLSLRELLGQTEKFAVGDDLL